MSATESPIDQTWRPAANKWLIAVSVTLGTFMEVLDSTIVNVSLPHIAGSLSIGVDEATWVITSYLVANGIVIPVSGWLSTVFGRKRYFLLCLGMFTVCSCLCGLSTSLPELLLFRLFQGISGGGLQTTQQTILLDTFSTADRPKAFAFAMVTVVLAPVIGPTLGGFITDYLSWRWLFLINIPIGIVACLLVATMVEDPPWEKARSERGAAPIDYVGLSLLAIGLGSFQIVLDRGEEDAWFSSSFICIVASLSLCSLLAAFVWLSEAKNPVLGLKPLSNRNFVIGALITSGATVPFFSVNVLLPQLVQSQFGYTSELAGLVMSPGGIASIMAIALTSTSRFKMSNRNRLLIGLGGLGCAMLNLSRVSPDADYGTLATMRFIQGSFGAFLFVPITSIAYATLPRESLRDATSLFSMWRNIISSVGVSITTAMVVQRSQLHMAYLSEHLSPFSFGYTETTSRDTATLTALGMSSANAIAASGAHLYQTLIRQSSIMGYQDVFQFGGLMALTVIPLLYLVKLPPAVAPPPESLGH